MCVSIDDDVVEMKVVPTAISRQMLADLTRHPGWSGRPRRGSKQDSAKRNPVLRHTRKFCFVAAWWSRLRDIIRVDRGVTCCSNPPARSRRRPPSPLSRRAQRQLPSHPDRTRPSEPSSQAYQRSRVARQQGVGDDYDGLTGCSVRAAASFPAEVLNLGMHHPHVSCQRIIARERLLLATHGTSDFLLAVVVNRFLVTRQIIRTGEDRVARLVCRWVDPRAFVRPCLRVASLNRRRGHARRHR